MKNRCVHWYCCLLALLMLACTSTIADAQQQRRQKTLPPGGYYLPRATFPSYASGGASTMMPGGGAAGAFSAAGGGMTLPGSSGMSLPEGTGMSLPSGVGTELPRVSGVHLQEGMDRREGSGVQPYDPGEPSLNMAWVRWDQRRFPLKIWISEGKQLPDVPWETIVQDRVPRVAAMLADPRAFDKLPAASQWKPSMNDAVADGFELWRDMQNEGVISYGFVDRPEQADILVFFTDHFAGADGPGGTSVHGQTYGQLFTTQQVMDKLRLGQHSVPVVMELKASEEYAQLRSDAAHEFGHALGIKAHSPYRQDIMYVNRIVDSPSPADKATLRALYKKNPMYWYY